MAPRVDLLPGTLDMLVLKAVSLGPLHGYGVLLRLEQMTGGALLVEQGALYPALVRLEQQGLLDTEWGVSRRDSSSAHSTNTRTKSARWRRASGSSSCGDVCGHSRSSRSS